MTGQDIEPSNDRRNRKSFANLGLTFAGKNLLELAKETGAVNEDKKFPVYEFLFSFVGYKFEKVKLEGKEEFESVLFLSPDGTVYSAASTTIAKQMREEFESSPLVAKDEVGNFKMDKAGFIQTTEPIEPIFTYYEGRGDYAGYSKLN